jgi:branched-chain amino acid transport system permease protein
MNYLLHILIYLCIYSIVALSLNLVVGYCGLLVLSHAGYFAIGSYACTLAMLRLGWGFLPAAALGIAVAILLSLAVSLPAWRFKGDYFVMVSLAVQSVIISLLTNWARPDAEIGTLRNLTNGVYGITSIPVPTILGHKLSGESSVAVLAVVLAVVCALAAWLLTSSPWGRMLKCMRDDELAARGLGKNVRLAKVQAFALACGMAALAGALYAPYVGYIDPSSAALNQSVLMLCMVIVGGAGNFRGPLVGAVVLLAIPELLRFAHVPVIAAANYRLIIYGALLVVLMHFRPQGIAGEYRLK